MSTSDGTMMFRLQGVTGLDAFWKAILPRWAFAQRIARGRLATNWKGADLVATKCLIEIDGQTWRILDEKGHCARVDENTRASHPFHP